MDFYIDWVTANPMLSAAAQFALLGTLGEVISHILRTRKIEAPFGAGTLLFKMLAWAVLGMFVKLGFVGVRGAVTALWDHHYLPSLSNTVLGSAVTISVVMNLFFGPQLMLFHRLEDCLIARKWSFSGMKGPLLTLFWFWIPAHTVTFLLDKPYQIGLAAVWSLALGIIMGMSKK